jgi:hypothetical protein
MKNEAGLIAVSFPEKTDRTYAGDQAMEEAYVQHVSGGMFRSFDTRTIKLS